MSMKKRMMALCLVLVLAVSLVPASFAENGWNSSGSTTAYVATANKGYLNVRSGPSTYSNNITDTLNWGTQVVFLQYAEGGYNTAWSWISYTKNNRSCTGYVMSKYISFTNPRGTVTPKPTSDPKQSLDSLGFSAFKKVSPYAVYANPDRPTGWVNLRWAPSTDADVQQRCYQYRHLVVIAQSSTWAQVIDPETGVVGFISRIYVRDLGYGVSIDISGY